ncbi:MAG: PIG-L deacetylase family protein [Candidatus Woesearchaeota archaeon]
MKKKETILAIGAHNDDPIFGAGGTLAKYAEEGKTIKTVIFSFGELSHPYLKPEVIIEQRVKEAIKADKIIGGKGVAYFGVKEGKFRQEIKQKNVEKRLLDIIKKEKPTKIFTHGANDAHPDHVAVYNLINDLVKKKKITCDVYTYDVWELVRFRKRIVPHLVVDITKTFPTKIKAIKAHKSQQITILNLLWTVYLKALINGWNNNCKYAEVFDKI